MRIAYITYEFPLSTGKGGIGTYTRQAAKAMAAMNWDVHVFAGSLEDINSYYLDGYNLHLTKCDGPGDFKYKVLGNFTPEHAHLAFDLMESPEINGNAWEVKKRHPEVPLIVRLHAPNYLVENLKKKYFPFLAKLRFVAGALRRLRLDAGYWRRYNKLVDPDYQFIQLANFLTAPSEAMKQWAVANWQIPVEKITVIPNIFLPPDDLVTIPVERELKYRRVVFFGRLNVLKGLVNATKAMKKILNEYPAWKFRVIGEDGPGPANNTTMRNWMKLQLKDVIEQVEFLEGLDYENLPHAIRESEIVLLPSLFESFSYTCAEAMAAGKAVIGSNNGGMADLLQNKESGILVNPESHNEIYSALKRLIDNNELRYQLSLKARQRIMNDFDATETAFNYAALYNKEAHKEFAKN